MDVVSVDATEEEREVAEMAMEDKPGAGEAVAQSATLSVASPVAKSKPAKSSPKAKTSKAPKVVKPVVILSEEATAKISDMENVKADLAKELCELEERNTDFQDHHREVEEALLELIKLGSVAFDSITACFISCRYPRKCRL